MVDWLWKPVLGLGTKDLDQGLGFHLECGVGMMFQSDFTEAGSVGQGGGTGAGGRLIQCLALGEGHWNQRAWQAQLCCR